MKDQTAALKRIQENIETFGGDPKGVTIAGESAGAASVHLHVHSLLSTGLFHRTISQSGTALAVWAVIESPTARQRTRALGLLSGCPELEIKALVECLRKVPAEQLANAFTKFYLFTDGYFTVDSLEAARRHNDKVFFYLYDHRNNLTFNELFANDTQDLGVCHGADQISLFDMKGLFPPVTEGPDYAASLKFVNYWVNFIGKGEPNGKEKIWQLLEPENFE